MSLAHYNTSYETEYPHYNSFGGLLIRLASIVTIVNKFALSNSFIFSSYDNQYDQRLQFTIVHALFCY